MKIKEHNTEEIGSNGKGFVVIYGFVEAVTEKFIKTREVEIKIL